MRGPRRPARDASCASRPTRRAAQGAAHGLERARDRDAARRTSRASTTGRTSTSCTRTTPCPPTRAWSRPRPTTAPSSPRRSWRDNVFACQFHPEKSQARRAALLDNFAALAGARRAARVRRRRADRLRCSSSRRSICRAVAACASCRATARARPSTATIRSRWRARFEDAGARVAPRRRPRRRASRGTPVQRGGDRARSARARRRAGRGRRRHPRPATRSSACSPPAPAASSSAPPRSTIPSFFARACRRHPGAHRSPASTRARGTRVGRGLDEGQRDRRVDGARGAAWRAAGAAGDRLHRHQPRRHRRRARTSTAVDALAARSTLPVIASGGVASLDDVRALARARRANLDGRDRRPRALHRRRRPRRRAALGARRGAVAPMLAKRIIPCLDVKDGRVVKGVNFVELRDAGDPGRARRALRPRGRRRAHASSTSPPRTRRGRSSSTSSRAPPSASSCRSPSAAACARSTTSARCSNAGADKVSINTAAVERPEFVDEAARALRQPVHRRRDRRQARARRGRRPRRRAWRSSRTAAAGRPASTPSSGRRAWSAPGAGEILLTSMDRDGTQAGYDLDAHARGRRPGRHPGDRLGRRRHARAPLRRPRRPAARRGARRVDLPLRHVHGPRVQGVPAARGVPVRI